MAIYEDKKERKIKEIGSSFAIIFNKKEAKLKGFKKDDPVKLTIEKEDE